MKISMDEVYEMCESTDGYCTECDDITRSGCEPDARKYPCPDCGQNTVYGIEWAVMTDLIEVVE